jgi:predicted dehydrogenase
LRLRIYGTRAGLRWSQEDPNYLSYCPLAEPPRLITRNGAGAGDQATRVSRIPAGHPEGYLEGFANIYSEAAAAIRARRDGLAVPSGLLYPTAADGVRGVAFVEACIASSKRNGAWVRP